MPEQARKPADYNRRVRKEVIREIDRLMEVASDKDFAGTVGVEISSKAGRLGNPKFTHIRYGGQKK